jgi:hypothetical protein
MALCFGRPEIASETSEKEICTYRLLSALKIHPPNEIWVMDFVHDRMEHGQKIKFLKVIDEGWRACLEIRTENRITGRDFIETLDGLMEEGGWPECINKEFRQWLSDLGAQPVSIEPKIFEDSDKFLF